MRHRQAAARPRGRQHPRRRDADVPQPLGAHPQRHAQEGPRARRGTRPAQAPRATSDRPRSPLRPLREDLQALAGKRHQGAALFHHRLPEHRHLEARLRLISGFHRKNEDGTTTLENGRLALFRNFDEHGNPLPARTRCSSTASSSKPAMPWTTTSAAWPPTRSSASAARSSSAPATADRREHHRPGTAPRGHEHRRQARPLGRVHPLRGLGLDAHRRLGRQHRHPCPRHSRLRHPASVRAGHWPRPAPPVLRPERRRTCSTSNTPTSWAFPSTSPPSRSSRRRSRRARPFRSRPSAPSAMHLEIRFPARRRAIASNCPKNG